jgi:hypothetical protein
VNPLSIGSFFHEDLAYLAALQAQGELPAEVERKQHAWWKLLVWYLNDDLKTIDQSLRNQPFLDWVPRLDGKPVFDGITWLEHDRKIIGVVSPVLLVRPLPDENLDRAPWTDPVALTNRVRGRLTELVRSLQNIADETGQKGKPPFAFKLASIINGHDVAPPANAGESDIVLAPFSFLDPYSLKSTSIPIPTGEGSYLIPICLQCGAPLLPNRVEVALNATSFSLTCDRCNTLRPFDFSAFGCGWVDGEFVVWRDRALQWADKSRPVRLPPVPKVDRDRGLITFTYPAVSTLASLQSSPELIFVLQGGATARAIDRLLDLNYPNYLWPGDPDPNAPVTAVPIPLRIENASLANREGSSARKVNKNVEVTLSLKGLPAAVSWIFIPSSMQTSAIAIYPDPAKVPPSWSWFELATDDSVRMALPPDTTAARTIGEQRVRAERNATDLPTVELSSKTGAGSCSLLLLRKDPRATTQPIEFFVGFDFGSSNTALQFRSNQSAVALAGVDLRDMVATLTLSSTRDAAADRLAPKNGANGTSFPSYYCDQHHVARVTPTPCCNAFTNGDVLFKSDERWGDVRTEYISEMLIHGLIGGSKHLGPNPLNVKGVFSYPLTFTKGRREKFEGEVRSAVNHVSASTGVESRLANVSFVDEATAGVASLGQPQAREVVVTADLGGGTLDISAGRSSDGPEKDQIGSTDAGGALFLQRDSADMQKYVDTVARISRGEVDRGEWATLRPHIDRYYQLLFVFLETILGSYLVRRAQHDSVEKVSIYPLGNGWRFHELMVNPMQVEPSTVVKEQITRLTANLAAAIQAKHGIKVDAACHIVENPKGAVAKGCLAVATTVGNRIPADVKPRLPLGITSSSQGKPAPWHDLFQSDVAHDTFVNDALDFDEKELRVRLETPNGTPWSSAPFDARRLRADMQKREYYWEGVGLFTRGPMQMLIETQWLKLA